MSEILVSRMDSKAIAKLPVDSASCRTSDRGRSVYVRTSAMLQRPGKHKILQTLFEAKSNRIAPTSTPIEPSIDLRWVNIVEKRPFESITRCTRTPASGVLKLLTISPSHFTMKVSLACAVQ